MRMGAAGLALLAGLLVTLMVPAAPSVCVVSFWEAWGPCVGDCNFALSVRNRDVIRPPFPERIRDGRLAIRPCPVLYQVQTCDLDEPCREEGAQGPSHQAAGPAPTDSARLPPRLHKFGAAGSAESEEDLADESGAAIHAAGGVAHKAPVKGPPRVPVADVPLVEARPPAISVPSWQAESFRGARFRANDSSDPFAGAEDFDSAAKPSSPLPKAAPPTVAPASTQYFVADLSETSATLAPIVAQGGVPRARFSLKRRPSEDPQEFVPLHQGAAAIEVPGQTKRPIALAPTTAKATSATPTTEEPSTVTATKAETTTEPLPSTTAEKSTVLSQTTPKGKSEVAPSVVSSANKAHKDVVRKAMQIPRSAQPIPSPPAPVLRIEEQEAAALPTIYYPEATRAPTTPRRLKPLTTALPRAPQPVRRLPTKPPPTEASKSSSIHDSVFTAANGVRLPKETLVGFVPAANTDEEAQAPVAKTKITILGPTNKSLGPNGELVKTPIFAPKGLAGAKEVAESSASSPDKAALPVFSKRTKAKAVKKSSGSAVRRLRWWEVLALTPKPSTRKPGLPTTARPLPDSAKTETSPPAVTQPSLRVTTARPPSTKAPSQSSKIFASAGDKCGNGKPSCCRPEPKKDRRCANGRRPQNVVRWGRNKADRDCVPYNYAYCGYQAEIDDGRPMKFKQYCESECFSQEERDIASADLGIP